VIVTMIKKTKLRMRINHCKIRWKKMTEEMIMNDRHALCWSETAREKLVLVL